MWAEIRYSARSLARTPALAAARLLTIALETGANVAVGGFVRGLTPERPIPEAGGLVSLFARDAQGQLTAVPSAMFLSHLSRTALAVERIASVLVSMFAGMAVTLGVLGLYGAMAEAARQRRRETAVRVALGASRWRIVGRVFVDGGRLALAGAVAGLIGSLFVGRWLARATSTSGSPTVWTCLAAVAILTVAVTLASILPARRATMLNPFTTARDVG